MTNKVLTDEEIENFLYAVETWGLPALTEEYVIRFLLNLKDMRQQVKDKTQEVKDWRDCAEDLYFSPDIGFARETANKKYHEMQRKYPGD